jgi:beta-lactamase regulating signal transducer with metallopeptidase domain
MTKIAGWLNPETMRLTGLALLHFLWQGGAIAAAAFMGMSVVRRAAARYVIGVAMLAMMVAAPVVTFVVLQRHQPETVRNTQIRTRSATKPALAALSSVTSENFSLGAADAQKSSSIYLMWFVQAWFFGVLVLSLRPAAGLFFIERLRLKQGTDLSGALGARCLELQRRLKILRVVQYCESLQLEAPAVVGWFRPVVLLPVSALTGLSTQQLEAVIAHELAHVKRLDAFVNLFQMAAEALLFYHPAVWWLSKRIRAERENCCDDVAISLGGNAVEYARALAAMAEWQSAPALAMAANRSPLTARVARLLGVTKLSVGSRGAGIAGSVLCLCASVLAGNALLGAVQTKQAASTRASKKDGFASMVQRAGEENRDAAMEARRVTRAAVAVPVHVVAHMLGSPAAGDATARGRDEQDQKREEKKSDSGAAEAERNESSSYTDGRETMGLTGRNGNATGSYIEGLKAEGFTGLTVDQLIALKVQGVTAEYVHGIKALGLKPEVNDLIAMKVQGVTPELIRGLRDSGMALDIDEIVAMKVQGVTPEYVKQLHDAGIKVDSDNILGMKVQGVTGEYIREMREINGADVSSGELIGLKVQGVTAEYVRKMKTLGFALNAGEIIGMKIQGVTPEYVGDIKALGLHPDANDVIGMKVQGVTADYIKGLQAAGLKLEIHAVIDAKVMGITPEFAEKARQHGFQNLTVRKLMALKNSGVLD